MGITLGRLAGVHRAGHSARLGSDIAKPHPPAPRETILFVGTERTPMSGLFERPAVALEGRIAA